MCGLNPRPAQKALVMRNPGAGVSFATASPLDHLRIRKQQNKTKGQDTESVLDILSLPLAWSFKSKSIIAERRASPTIPITRVTVSRLADLLQTMKVCEQTTHYFPSISGESFNGCRHSLNDRHHQRQRCTRTKGIADEGAFPEDEGISALRSNRLVTMGMRRCAGPNRSGGSMTLAGLPAASGLHYSSHPWVVARPSENQVELEDMGRSRENNFHHELISSLAW